MWPGDAPDEPDGISDSRADAELGKDGVIRIPYVDQPELVRFASPGNNAAGTGIIICPGGAYMKLAWNKEGTEVAEWLSKLGIQAFVLKYRVPRRDKEKPHPWPLQDLKRAMRVVRSKAKEWNVDPNRLGVMGFSAGGHLAAMSTSQKGRTYERIDDADKLNAQPDFAALIYPAYLGSRKTDEKALAPTLRIDKRSPPTFIAITHDDADRALFAALYYAELRRSDVSAELHIYSRGGHGYGMRASPNAVSNWPSRMEDWLRASDLIK